MVDTVIKGNVVGKVIEIPFLLLGGYDGAGHFPDIADPLLLFLGHRLGGGIRTQVSAGSPYHNEFLFLVVHHLNDGQIFRLGTLSLVEHILQITIYLVYWDAF